ncbi:hypothetical protein, partial [Pelomonas sp. Root1444]|uniref:AbiU2 domain-containing protein n=1 Tax=Pelomonas sp. Root1444 TaxID=1736464 RepID=UPI00138F5473
RLTSRTRPQRHARTGFCRLSLSINDALLKCEFARDWRNRHIAHADLDLALGETAQPLATASRLQVKEALKAIEDVLNTVSIAFLDSATRFGDMVLINAGEDLIYLLDFAIRKQEERSKRFESGEYTEDDLAELHPRQI